MRWLVVVVVVVVTANKGTGHTIAGCCSLLNRCLVSRMPALLSSSSSSQRLLLIVVVVFVAAVEKEKAR